MNISQAFDEDLCHDNVAPSTFNSPAYLSTITGNTVHFSSRVLVDVYEKVDYTTFNLTESSLLRIYVPLHPSVDIDVYVRSGTPNTPGDYKAAVTDTGVEEIIHISLEKGQYFIRFNYYALPGRYLPDASECVSYPMMITIYPKSYFANVMQVTRDCAAVVPSTQLVKNTPTSGTYYRLLVAPR